MVCFKFPLKIPYYTPSLCYQYPPSASPGRYYSEEEQRPVSHPLQVSEGEDDLDDYSYSFRKDTSEYFQHHAYHKHPKNIIIINHIHNNII